MRGECYEGDSILCAQERICHEKEADKENRSNGRMWRVGEKRMDWTAIMLMTHRIGSGVPFVPAGEKVRRNSFRRPCLASSEGESSTERAGGLFALLPGPLDASSLQPTCSPSAPAFPSPRRPSSSTTRCHKFALADASLFVYTALSS